MESLRQDVKLAIRLLLKQPSFSLLAITTLGLGIGASVALFSVLDAAFIRPLPYAKPEQLFSVSVEMRQPNREPTRLDPYLADVTAWQQDRRVFSHVAYSRTSPVPMILDGEQPVRLQAQRASAEYFSMYGATPFLGRAFTADEYARLATDVVVIGHDFWKARFHADPKVIGTSVRLNGVPAEIVGVMPAWFYAKTKVWQPFSTQIYPAFVRQRGSGTSVAIRLRDGVAADEASAHLSSLSAALAPDLIGSATAVTLTSMYEDAIRSNVTTARVIAYAVGVVLLLACVNVAGLLLARGAVRRPEMAVRASLGAGRPRLLRQLMTESLLLALCGTALGLLLAWWWLDVLVANTPMYLPANAPVTINLAAIAFAVVTAMVTALLFGLVPAWRVSGATVSDTLARANRRHGSALSRRGGQSLIAIEVALAVVLMAGAGLMLRSFSRVLAVDLGFDPGPALALDVSPVGSTVDAHAQYYPALVQRLSAHPAVEAAGAVDAVPLVGGGTYSAVRANGESHRVTIRRYVGAYFDAVGFSLKEGQFPTAALPAGGLAPAIISESAARKMFGDRPAIGNTVEAWEVTHQIVAVMRDVRYRGPISTRAHEPEVYVPTTTMFSSTRAPRPLTVLVRPRQGATLPPNFLREAVQSAGQRAILEEINPASSWLGDTVVTPRRRTVLLGLLGGLGLVLALVGIFGVTAYAVSRRTQEIGVRMAFGATHRNVVGVMVRDSTSPVAIGVAAGLLASWWATKAISTFLFQTEPRDLATFAWVAALLAAAAFIAAWIPARRAARVDPIIALRAE